MLNVQESLTNNKNIYPLRKTEKYSIYQKYVGCLKKLVGDQELEN